MAGNNLLIDHGNGEYSSLGHLQQGSVLAKVGDTVTRGQVIGRVGSSGPSDHPHLHYQLMAGTDLTRSDGLPSQFVKVWLEDTRAQAPVQIKVPKRGIQLVAR
ncbi:MAG TPA: M23 family metallopeptidase [Vicinamibacterales bacterium]|nr:M23 family metallopeptidase [Vicinamibacterales bacterium]